ncbi:D-aminoacyl-tRNA deacylase [Desulfosarcina sp. OttesenSCG-928-B08]|nr:D-aminoacyl-tRNA deacylase [Desulfosarcina sp. OttesenSCG-928-B08]
MGNAGPDQDDHHKKKGCGNRHDRTVGGIRRIKGQTVFPHGGLLSGFFSRDSFCFSLFGDCRKGRRPSFVSAAEPTTAQNLCRLFVDQVRAMAIDVRTGRFGAMMQVSITNEGPVTLIVNSRSKG